MLLRRSSNIQGTAKLLPASKSISNRALIIRALAGGSAILENLSDANDTQLMLNRISSDETTIDVEDAGTTMRFLTAYFAATGQHKILTGTSRMKERPIGILVDALITLGASVEYIEKKGYPPVETNGFAGQKTNDLAVRGDISSQYISALMMIAPLLPQGLEIKLEGKVGSRPYIVMTAEIMKHFGVTCDVGSDLIRIPSSPYEAADFFVESDWSAASYWYAFTALSDEADIRLPKLFEKSLQGDSVIRTLMNNLGVTTQVNDGVFHLSKGPSTDELSFDFTDCPDLAQTVAVVCAAKGIKGYFTGLESLRIKETDRIAALQNELQKIGADLIEDDTSNWRLIPATSLPGKASFETYKDHRMAMAFAPLCTKMDVSIVKPEVVRKSYPNFWNDLKACGVAIEDR